MAAPHAFQLTVVNCPSQVRGRLLQVVTDSEKREIETRGNERETEKKGSVVSFFFFFFSSRRRRRRRRRWRAFFSASFFFFFSLLTLSTSTSTSLFSLSLSPSLKNQNRRTSPRPTSRSSRPTTQLRPIPSSRSTDGKKGRRKRAKVFHLLSFELFLRRRRLHAGTKHSPFSLSFSPSKHTKTKKNEKTASSPSSRHQG